MLDKQLLFDRTQYHIDGEIKEGKVLGVATYFDHQRVLFQGNGEPVGKWIPALDITDSRDVKTNFEKGKKKTTDNHNNLKNTTLKKESFSTFDNSSSKTESFISIDQPSSQVTDSISLKNIDNANPNQFQNVLCYCNEVVSSFLNPFSSQTFDLYQEEVDQVKGYENKYLPEDIVSIITANIIASNVRGSAYEMIREYLGNFDITQDNSQTILNDLASFNTMTSKSDYFEKNNLNIIWDKLQALLTEKLQSTIDLSNHLFDTRKYTILLVELIYKIGYIYGFDHRSNTPEFITIISVALSSSMLKKMVEGNMNTQIPIQLMLPISSIVTLSIVSYTARCYYQSQATISTDAMTSKLQSYIESISFKHKVMELLPQQ